MIKQSYPICMEIAGHTAMWTRPDTGDCPVSYPAPTYSAVKGIFESLVWGPAIEIVPTKVEICAPIQYHTYCTNYGGPLRQAKSIAKGNNYQQYATVLVDVCYRLYADIIINKDKSNLPPSAIHWDSKTSSPGHATQSIFERRLKRGQSYSIPVLGWKEFTPSYVGVFRPETTVQTELSSIILPSILRQVFPHGYSSAVSFTYDTNLKIENGTLIYPRKE